MGARWPGTCASDHRAPDFAGPAPLNFFGLDPLTGINFGGTVDTGAAGQPLAVAIICLENFSAFLPIGAPGGLLNFVFQESFDLAGDFDAWDQLQGAFFNRGGALGNDLASYQGYVNLVPVGAGLAALSIIGAAGPQPFGPLRRGPLPVAVGPMVTLTGVLHVNLANGDGVRILGDDRTWVALFPRGVVPNPEPATLWMVGVGVLAVTLQRTRPKR